MLCHSDAVFSAVTSAMGRLGLHQEWFDATVRAPSPAVRFSSLYPFQKDLLLIVPPRSVWPPPPSTKVRYKGARFVPLHLVGALLADEPVDEDRWIVDGESACLIPSDKHWQQGPFRSGLRSNAGVDRVAAGMVAVHQTACLEFARDAGLWMLVVFADEATQEVWRPRVRSALRWLADSGMGGERSRGWGRSSEPEWQSAPELTSPPPQEGTDEAYWLLSLYAPAPTDVIDWNRGNYSVLERSGRIESPERWGDLKATTQMIAEGSVLLSAQVPRGEARDVGPEAFPHPVYRAGYAVTISIPWRLPQ